MQQEWDISCHCMLPPINWIHDVSWACPCMHALHERTCTSTSAIFSIKWAQLYCSVHLLYRWWMVPSVQAWMNLPFLWPVQWVIGILLIYLWIMEQIYISSVEWVLYYCILTYYVTSQYRHPLNCLMLQGIMPPIGFAVLFNHVEVVKLLLTKEQMDKSIAMVHSVVAFWL